MKAKSTVLMGASIVSAALLNVPTANAQSGNTLTTQQLQLQQIQRPPEVTLSPSARQRIGTSPGDAMWTQAGWMQGNMEHRINPDGSVLTQMQAARLNVPQVFEGGPAAPSAAWTQLGWNQGGAAQRFNPDGSVLTVRQALRAAQR